MKKLALALVLLIGIASFNSTIEAQNINISINIGRQPAWGPVGYDYAGYYYFPDIDCYYDVNLQLFYYMNRGRWVSARYLPYAYRHYDLYNLYKVVLNGRDPWRQHHVHYRDYARYRGHKNQYVIRDSRDTRYRDSRNNRVTWYSNDNKHYNNKKDNGYNNNRYTNNRYSSSNSNNRNSNNNNQKYNSNNANKKKDYKPAESRSDKNTVRNNNRTYNSSSSNRSNSSSRSTSNVRKANSSRSTNQSKEYRLVSGSERSSRGR